MSWGEIYNTSWWGIALDTARTVKARPDFFGSQLNLLTSEQDNIVTNGDFSNGSTGWTLGSGWNIANGKITFTNGGSVFNPTANSWNSGITFLFKITISDRTSGYIRIQNPSASIYYANNINTNGELEFTFNSIDSDGWAIQAQGGFNGSLTNISVQVARAELDQIEAKKCLADWIHTTALKDLNN